MTPDEALRMTCPFVDRECQADGCMAWSSADDPDKVLGWTRWQWDQAFEAAKMFGHSYIRSLVRIEEGLDRKLRLREDLLKAGWEAPEAPTNGYCTRLKE